MFGEALLAAIGVALVSIVGVLFFRSSGKLIGVERLVVPLAVGVLLGLILLEIIPETIATSPTGGAAIIAFGFVAFYILSHFLHKKFHHLDHDNCHRKGTAYMILVGDGIHNIGDGIILASAFLINPAVGIATAVGIALHETLQEIVEYGILIRAGYTRKEAIIRNLISASGVIVGVVVMFALSAIAGELAWVLIAFAGGNLLYVATNDLLPSIHGNLKNYGIWSAAFAILVGFALMASILTFSHNQFGHGSHVHDDHNDEHHEEDNHDQKHFDEEHHDDEDHEEDKYHDEEPRA